MSKNLSAQERTDFEDEVKHQYDKPDSGILGNVRHKKLVQSGENWFPRFSKGVAKDRSARGKEDDVTGMGVGSDRIKIELGDWEAPEYTDIFDQAKTNIDDRKELAIAIAGAMKRRQEQTVIDAWKNADYAANLNARDLVANKYKAFKIPHNNKTMTKEKITKAKALMVNRNVTGQLYAAATAEDLEAMLNDTTITSNDYNTIRALVEGDIDTWCGFKWSFIGVRPEGGLPYDNSAGDGTAITQSFFWEKMSTGQITNLERVEVNYIAEKTSWLSNGLFQAGAKMIDPEGLVQIQSKITEPA